MRRSLLSVSRSAGASLYIASRGYSTPGKVRVFIKTQDGTSVDFEAPAGTSLMHAVRDVAMLQMDGACDGCMQCATCHVYLSPSSFEKTGPPSEAEQDMLDKCLEVQDTSRLACQIQLTPELDGVEVELPKNIVNLMI